MNPATTTDGVDAGTFGLVVVGGAEIAIEIGVLREVLPCPAELAPLPVSSQRLLGAMELRSQVLPIVDVLQPRQVELGGTQIVVVLAHAGRTLGLLADGIRGLVRVERSAMHELTAVGADLIASHTFLHPDDRRVVSVLDVATVLSLEGVPVVHADAAVATAARNAPVTERRVLTVLRCGAHTVAVDVADVHTIVPNPAPIDSVLTGGCCIGATVFGDEKVALIDVLVVLGLGAMPSGVPEAGMVLRSDEGLVVLALSSTLDIVSVAPAEILPVPVHAVARPDIVQGLLARPGGSALVLDPSALRADPELRSLAGLRTPVDASQWAEHEATRIHDGSVDTAALRPTGVACLSFSIGFDVATPLEQIDEIIPMPDQLTEAERIGRTIGVALHRDSAIPLVLLSELLGREVSITSTQCVLVVDVDGERWGVVVDRLNEIATRTWAADPDDVAGAGGLAGARLITLGGSRSLVPEIDLRAILRVATGGLLVDAVGVDEHAFGDAELAVR